MKTQLLTLIITLVFSINSFGIEKNIANNTPDQIPVGDLTSFTATVEEENLTIQDWMTNDACWQNEQVTIDLENEPEDELTIQPWMTNAKLWEAKREPKSNITTLKIGNETYKVYRITTEKEAPLRVEAWMTNDKLWRL